MTMQIQFLSFLLCLWLVFQISNCERLDFESRILQVNWFHEGINLELHCQQDTTNDINIELNDQGIIVERSHLLHGVTDEYEFEKNSTVSVLFIKALKRSDDGIYFCSEGGQNKKIAQVNVLYSPSDKSPQCMSNYESPVIFDDLRQDNINFTCITEGGNPPVKIKIYILQSNSTYNVSDVTKLCTERVYDKGLSFNCHMNESLNNAMFLCNVTQQFRYPYSGGYSGSCSFGPLHFLSSFLITINETNVTVTEGHAVNLTCITNVSEVEIKWIGIPVDWEYYETKGGYLSHLRITQVKQHSKAQITVQCIGSHGNRNVTDSVKINIMNIQSGKTILVLFMVILAIGLLTIITITASIFLYGYYSSKRVTHELTLDHQQSQNSFNMNETLTESNTNNANNTAIKVREGLETNNSDRRGYQLQKTVDMDMCVNPVYESASVAANTTVYKQDDTQYASISKKENGVGIYE